MYYPPSQIVTDQYSSGGEFMLNGVNYQGNYWFTSDGNFFTGKSPQDNPTVKLTKVALNKAKPKNPKNVQSQVINSRYNINPSYYNALQKPYNPALLDAKAPQPPLPVLPFPTEQDYEYGEFQRYFAKKNNENKYIETDKKTYQGLVDKNPGLQCGLYTPLTMTWTLDGKMDETFLTNKRMVELEVARSKWFGFTKYFNGDYLQYFKGKDKKIRGGY